MADVKPEEQFAQAQQGGQGPQFARGGPVQGRKAASTQAAPEQAAPEKAEPAEAAEKLSGSDAGAPWLVADADLYISNPDSGAAPARAFAPGDRVPSDMAAQYGWAAQCHVPDWALPEPARSTGPAPDTEEK